MDKKLTPEEFLRFKARLILKSTKEEDLPPKLRVLKRSARPLTVKEAKKVLAHAE